MLEKKLYQNVDKLLPKSIHKQSMTFIMSNGCFDRYYDAPKSDLWVEYKMLSAMPRNGIVCCAPGPKPKRGHLSVLQYEWGARRHANGGNAIVVIGLPNKTASIQLDPQTWMKGVNVTSAVSIQEVAEWIQEFCGR